MIIDNKQKLNKKYDIVTVWVFIEKYTKNGIKTIDGNFCHAKTYIYNDPNPDNSYYLTGSSNLTESGLGIYQSSNIEINIAERNADNKNFDALSDWFTKTWNDTAQDKIIVTENGQKIEKDVKQYFIDYFSSPCS